MSNQDYTKFSKNLSEENETPIDKTIPEVTWTVAEDDVVEEQKPLIFGKVAGCSKLNVRQYPNLRSDVLCCLAENAEIEIDEDKSTNDFYAICTPTGLEGFCLKEFVKISK